MWIALFFPLGFDEVTHDSGYKEGQIEKGRRYSTSLRLSFYVRWWKRLELETIDEIDGGQKWCTGKGERVMWTALFCPLGFDEVTHNSEDKKGQIKKNQHYTISLCLSFYAENYRKAHPITPIWLSFKRSPTFTRRNLRLEDVAILKVESIY